MRKIVLVAILAILSVVVQAQTIGWTKSEITSELTSAGQTYRYDFDGDGSMWIISYDRDLEIEYSYRISVGKTVCDFIILMPRTAKGYYGFLYALNNNPSYFRVTDDVWITDTGLSVVKGETDGKKWFSLTEDR